MKRSALAVLCVLAIIVALLPRWVAASGEPQVYQLAVNDTFVDADTGLTTANMPVAIGGTIYVPYTIFDRNATGVDLGVAYGQNKEGNVHILTLYSLGGTIVFDINAQTCTVSPTGEMLDMRAIIRNGKVYVPANGVCQFFGLQYSYRPTRSAGVLIRIQNSYAVLTDTQLMQSGASFMQGRYNRYIQGVAPSVTPVPTGGGSTVVTPVPSGEVDAPGMRVYLGILCSDGGEVPRILTQLKQRNVYAVFFFPVEGLARQDTLVRQVLGEGHLVGLYTDQSEAPAAERALEQGNAILERIAWTRTHLAYVEPMGRGTEERLKQSGWTLWETGVDGRASTGNTYLNTGSIVSKVKTKQNKALLLLDDCTATAVSLSRLLTRLNDEACILRMPIETELN